MYVVLKTSSAVELLHVSSLAMLYTNIYIYIIYTNEHKVTEKL